MVRMAMRICRRWLTLWLLGRSCEQSDNPKLSQASAASDWNSWGEQGARSIAASCQFYLPAAISYKGSSRKINWSRIP